MAKKKHPTSVVGGESESGDANYPKTFIELFAGVGGFRLGLERRGWRCVWANEFDKYAAEVYRNNFSSKQQGTQSRGWNSDEKEIRNRHGSKPTSTCRTHPSELCEGDIRKVKAEDIPDHTLLCAGFPCQTFSIAGKRKGMLDDVRGTLFHEIARVAQHKEPKFLLLENVKGLLSSRGGLDFAVILRTLDDLGYDAEWACLNSKHFGVPQNRERVFVFGVRRSGG